MNPILPRDCYVPDPEARVWSDGRLYLYGSLDVGGAQAWCSNTYRVYSTGDLVSWTDHGVALRKTDVGFATHRPLAAPDCVQRDGQYFLFFCKNGDGGRQGVARSADPGGPFAQPQRILGANQIDPAVLVDDDGCTYLFWGQISLCAAEMDRNMSSTISSTRVTDVLSETDHGFHEGASIRKINGLYYLLYTDISRGRPTCLSYAVSNQPLGPYEKKGVVIDNAEAGYLSWNNHGSLVRFLDQWYVVYHRSSRHGRFSRRACMEPITIANDGSIAEVEMTTQGPEPPLVPSRRIEAWRACSYYGGIWNEVRDDDEYVHADEPESLLIYRYLRFSGENWFEAEVRGEGRISVHVGTPYFAPSGSLQVNSLETWTRLRCRIAAYSGVGSVGLRFDSGELSIRWFSFFHGE
jgi:hypothetical protein